MITAAIKGVQFTVAYPKLWHKAEEKQIVVSHFIFLLRQASEGVFFSFLVFFLFQIGLFTEEKRVLHHSYVF
jgi:hypothetical protein